MSALSSILRVNTLTPRVTETSNSISLQRFEDELEADFDETGEVKKVHRRRSGGVVSESMCSPIAPPSPLSPAGKGGDRMKRRGSHSRTSAWISGEIYTASPRPTEESLPPSSSGTKSGRPATLRRKQLSKQFSQQLNQLNQLNATVGPGIILGSVSSPSRQSSAGRSVLSSAGNGETPSENTNTRSRQSIDRTSQTHINCANKGTSSNTLQRSPIRRSRQSEGVGRRPGIDSLRRESSPNTPPPPPALSTASSSLAQSPGGGPPDLASNPSTNTVSSMSPGARYSLKREQGRNLSAIIAAGGLEQAARGIRRARTSVGKRKPAVEPAPPDPRGVVMGVPLVDVAMQSPGGQVPWLVTRCIAYLSSRGRIDSIGLFRVGGDGRELEALRNAADSGKQIRWDVDEEISGVDVLEMEPIDDLNVVAQLLKAYFRELPDPVIPFSVFPHVVVIAQIGESDPPRWISAMRSILWQIPSAHFATLKALCGFLYKVAERSEKGSKMTPENLGLVWGPNLIRSRDTNPFAIMKDLKSVTDSVKWLIERYHVVFKDF